MVNTLCILAVFAQPSLAVETSPSVPKKNLQLSVRSMQEAEAHNNRGVERVHTSYAVSKNT
jgi:hypothetical protein